MPDAGHPVGSFPELSGDGDSACNDGGLTQEQLLELAAAPQTNTTDGQTIVERSAADLIALDKHIASKRAKCATGGNAWGALGIARVVPPDSAGIQ